MNILEQENQISLVKQNLNSTLGQIKIIQVNLLENEDLVDTIDNLINEKELLKTELSSQLENQQVDYNSTLLKLSECKSLGNLLQEYMSEQDIENFSMNEISKKTEKQYTFADRITELKYLKNNNQQSLDEIEIIRSHAELEMEIQELNRTKFHKKNVGMEEKRNILIKLLAVQDLLVELHEYGYEHFESYKVSLTDKIRKYQKQFDIEFSKLKETQGNIKLYQDSYSELNLIHINDVQRSKVIENQVYLLKKELNDKEKHLITIQNDLIESSTKRQLLEESFKNEKQYQIKVLQSCHDDEVQSNLLNEQLQSHNEKCIHINQNIDKIKQEEEQLNQQQEENVNNISNAKSDINQSELLISSFKQQYDNLSIKEEILHKNKNYLEQEIKSTEECIISKTNIIELEKQKEIEKVNVNNMLNETLKDYGMQENETKQKLKDYEIIIRKIHAEIQPVHKNLETITEDLKGIYQRSEEHDEAQTIISRNLNNTKGKKEIIQKYVREEELKVNTFQQEIIKNENDEQDLRQILIEQDTVCDKNIEKIREKEKERIQCEVLMKEYSLDEHNSLQNSEQLKIQKIAAQERLQKVEKQKFTANANFQDLVEYKESIENQCKENDDAYSASQKIFKEAEENIYILVGEIENNKLKMSLKQKEHIDLNDNIDHLTQKVKHYGTEKAALANILKETDIQANILQNKLTGNESTMNNLNQDNEQITAGIETLKNTLKDYESQNNLIMLNSRELKEEEHLYNQQIKENDSLKSSLQIQIDDLEAKKRDITREHENIENDLNSLKKRIEENKTEHKTFQENFEETKSKHLFIQNTFKNLVVEREIVEKNIIELESKQYNLNTKNESLESNKKLMEEKLKDHIFQQDSFQNIFSDLVNRKDSSYKELNNHLTITNEAKISIEKMNTDIDSVSNHLKSVEDELNTEKTVLLELDVQGKTILNEIKEIWCNHKLIKEDIKEKESNVDSLFAEIQNEMSNKEKLEQKFKQSEYQTSSVENDLYAQEKLISNNNIIYRELEESIVYLNEQIQNNDIENLVTNQNLEKCKNEIKKIQDEITQNNSEENKWKKKLNEAAKIRSSIYEYLTEIKTQLAKETIKRSEIDNEISKIQCQKNEIHDKQTRKENLIKEGAYIKSTFESKLNNVESQMCAKKTAMENLDVKKSELLIDMKNKDYFQNENLQCLIKLETERNNLHVDLDKEENIKCKAIKLLSQSEKSIDLLSNKHSEIEDQIIADQLELSKLGIETDSLFKAMKENEILNDSFKKVLVESESQREMIHDKLRKHEIRKNNVLHDLIDSETQRDLLHEQLAKTSMKNKKDQIINKITDQEKKRVNSQNEIKQLVKTQDALQKQQTDEEKAHVEIQQQLKCIVENEQISKHNLQSNNIKIEETQKKLNDLRVLQENVQQKLFESKSSHELNTKMLVESDLTINLLSNKSKENENQIKSRQLIINNLDSELNIMAGEIKDFEKEQVTLNKEIDHLGTEKELIRKELNEQSIKLAEAQESILEILENAKCYINEADKVAEKSVENNLILTELEEKIYLGQKQLKEQDLTIESIKSNITNLQSHNITMNDKMKNYITNEDIEQKKLNALKLHIKSNKELLKEKILNMNTVQQTIKRIEENKAEFLKLTKEHNENKNNLLNMFSNSEALENSINDKLKIEKLTISNLYKTLTDRDIKMKSLNLQLEENTNFQEISNQKVNDLEALTKHLNMQVNEKESEKVLIEQKIFETEEKIRSQKELLSDLQNEIDLKNNMKYELENLISGLNNEILNNKTEIESSQMKCSEFNIQYSEFNESLMKLKEKENGTKKSLEIIEESRYSLLNELKRIEMSLSGLEIEYEKCQKHSISIKEKMEENHKSLFETIQEKSQSDAKNNFLINQYNEQKKHQKVLENKEKEMEELIILTKKIIENKDIQYAYTFKDYKEFQEIKISLQEQIKSIINKKKSLNKELENTESHIDLMKKEMNKKSKEIDEFNKAFDELSKAELFLNEQMKKHNSICSKESMQLTELKTHDKSLQVLMKNIETKIVIIKQELVNLEEERYLIYDDINKIENLELQGENLLKDFIDKNESIHSQLEQIKLNENALHELLKKSQYQKKLTQDKLKDIEKSIIIIKEKLKDSSEKINSKKDEETMLENQLLVISQELINSDETKEELSTYVNKNIKNQNELETKVSEFESQKIKYNVLINDLKNNLNEINCKRDLVHGKISDQSDHFDKLKDNIQKLEMEIDLYKKKLKDLDMQKTSMEQEIKNTEEKKLILLVQIKEGKKNITQSNMQLRDYELQITFLQERLKDKSNENNNLCLEYQILEKDRDVMEVNFSKKNSECESLHEDLNKIKTKIKLLNNNLDELIHAEKLKQNMIINVEAERDSLKEKVQMQEKEVILFLKNLNDLENQKQDFSMKIKNQVTELFIQEQKILSYNTSFGKLCEQLKNNEIKKSNVQITKISSEKLRDSYQEQILYNTNLSEKYKCELKSLDENKEFLINLLNNLDKCQAQIINNMKDSGVKIQEYIKNTKTQDSIVDFKKNLNEKIINHRNNAVLLQKQLDSKENKIDKIQVKYSENFHSILLEKQKSIQAFKEQYLLSDEINRKNEQNIVSNHKLCIFENNLKLSNTKNKTFQAVKERMIEQMQQVNMQFDLFENMINHSEENKIEVESQININIKKCKLQVYFIDKQQYVDEMDNIFKDLEQFSKSIKQQVEELLVCRNTLNHRNVELEKQIFSITEQMKNSEKQIGDMNSQRRKFKEQGDHLYDKLRDEHYLLNERYSKNKELSTQLQLFLEHLSDNVSSQNIYVVNDPEDNLNFKNKSLSTDSVTILPEGIIENDVNQNISHINKTKEENLEHIKHFPEDNYDKIHYSVINDISVVSDYHNYYPNIYANKDLVDKSNLDNKSLTDSETLLTEFNNEEKSQINETRNEILEQQKPFPENNCDKSKNSSRCVLYDVSDNQYNELHIGNFTIDANYNHDKKINIRQNIQSIENEINSRYEDLVELQIKEAISKELDDKEMQEVKEKKNETQDNLKKLEINKKMLYEELEINIDSQSKDKTISSESSIDEISKDLPILRHRQEELKMQNEVPEAIMDENTNHKSLQLPHPANSFNSSFSFKVRISIFISTIVFFLLYFNI
ncbi:unnamed protein product [Meganyctiphanes norvegica]|uniref:Uncharacterized protein n=1 Tax=Meganyctiphanes norvegica TaxID=48144 RepID=A0AAV2PQ45_MEGNR